MILPEPAPSLSVKYGFTLEQQQSLDSMEGVYSYPVFEVKPAALRKWKPLL
jgi:hypothetical protein